MRRVVIESPYAGDIDRNTLYARRAMADAISRGEAPLASHLLYTQPGILDENSPAERALGISCGYAWMKQAEVVIFYTDYGLSPGMDNAAKKARELQIPCQYRAIGKNP